MSDQYREWYNRVGCYHPPNCTRCSWCGFKHPKRAEMNPVFGYVKEPLYPHSLPD